MEERHVPYECVQALGRGPAVVLAPHPDDEVFGCGGAILRHVDAGDPVRVIVVTDGAAEAPPDSGSAVDYARERQRESRAAGRLLGYGDPEFWGLPDRGVRYGEWLVQRVVDTLRGSGTRLLYAPSVLEMHPDHRALGMVAAEAVRRVGGELRLAMYEVGVPLRPNRLLDVTDLLPRKRAAMAVFASQIRQRDYQGHVEALNRFRSYTLGPEVEAAEAYCVATAAEIAKDPMALYASAARWAAERGLPLDEQTQPLVSVVVRSMGRAALQEALDSLALQTYPRVEVVVVDALGRGHPPLPEWCGRFPLRSVAAGVPLSRSRAANRGLDAANGTFIAFLDDDDLLDPDHLAGLVGHLQNHPSLRAAYAGVRVVDRGPEGQGGIVRVMHEPFNAHRLAYENFIPIHAVVFHRDLLAAGCRFDEDLDVYEDWDFWLQAACHTPFARVDRLSATYRSGGGSGVGLVHARSADASAHRQRLYAKWRARWDASALDAIFGEYRRVRQESLEREQARQRLAEETARQRHALEAQQRLHQALAEQHRDLQDRSAGMQEQHRQEIDRLRQQHRQEIDAVAEQHRQAAARLQQLEQAHSRRLVVRVYRLLRRGRQRLGRVRSPGGRR
ncbi:PIG-L family deacetylase [Thioalkalivibrio nitratireducens]|nr:PIG-L family deacetylase [Thioalkalivibrio nitratireducens]